ncbi:saccharopine dehydrogenase-like NADP-dependent oxidoreductase [Aneurinibacillus soli]|uniref:Saccharopine dehydrogenase n=1 Tax=Aneurinibacillus soli TaxID=1500254 RepID=A0A0U4WKK6_9BACL|nr:saccharopine dehydrogenase NADP-binding domain-containing protein [Aneurinibacillus soli]PYE62938.1 saccharopine dehydrogenase-like NADP-dependent oxidoreductase [Aneurinibacillus soli]BAU29003.1 Saccharopine dehydrogenase [Aneurinibacillus soli]
MKNHIVVVGGYGHVGRMICRDLGELYPGKVFAAGRNFSRAEQFSRTTNGKIRPLQLNINETVDPDILKDVKLVVMCLDQTDPAFARTCFKSGIHYVDVSANGSFLSQLEGFHEEAAANHATAVLSVGLAPGLTNLLALRAKNLMDQTDKIDIFIMLGLGDKHGKAAIEWTVDNLSTDFVSIKDGSRVVVTSFKDGKKTDFGSELGHRKAYRFNFSDQHTLTRTLGVPLVSTRLCFDSALVTGSLAMLKTSGIFRLLKLKPIRNAVTYLFGKIQFGKEIYVVKIEALGKRSRQDVVVECLVQGTNEADITAKVAVSVADTVYRSELSHGVYHIDQLFRLENILPAIPSEVAIETRINGQRVC